MDFNFRFEELDFKNLVYVFSITLFLWEFYLSVRQHKTLSKGEIPKILKSSVTVEEFKKSKLYGADKSYFGFFNSIFGQLQTLAVLYFDLLPFFWKISGNVIKDYLGYDSSYQITQSIVFFGITSFLSSAVNLPFSLYSTFVIEERHGFNKQTLSLFFIDFAKGLFLGAVFGFPLIAGFLKVIEMGGENFFYYVWLFVVAFQLFFLTIFPTVIQPMFNKFTPLGATEEEKGLVEKIFKLAKQIKFPLTKIFVVDGSKRSSHSNAYFTGLFKNKRIVLFDTLLQQSSTEEILAVLAHEMGHWFHLHILWTLAVVQTHLFVVFYSFSKCINTREMYSAFGFEFATGQTPILIGFILFQYLLMPLESVMSFLMNIMSRTNEFQADRFAVKLGYGPHLVSGLIKIHVKNLGNLNPDPIYSAYHYTHPPLVERLGAINAAEAAKKPKDKKNK